MLWKIAISKIPSLIDNSRGYSERELFCITTILKPIVKMYEQYLLVHSYSVEFHRNNHQRCSKKKVFLEILQNAQENICARAFFLIKLCIYFEENFWTTASACKLDNHVEIEPEKLPVLFTSTSL